MANSGRPLKCDPKVNNLRINNKYGEYDIAKKTLSEFGIDATDGEARTALITAVIANKPDFVYWLIDNGANINHQDRIGCIILHITAEFKLVELTKYLLEKGANPNLQNKHGNTPLWTAIFNAQ